MSWQDWNAFPPGDARRESEGDAADGGEDRDFDEDLIGDEDSTDAVYATDADSDDNG